MGREAPMRRANPENAGQLVSGPGCFLMILFIIELLITHNSLLIANFRLVLSVYVPNVLLDFGYLYCFWFFATWQLPAPSSQHGHRAQTSQGEPSNSGSRSSFSPSSFYTRTTFSSSFSSSNTSSASLMT
jgi:hypothetical protein